MDEEKYQAVSRWLMVNDKKFDLCNSVSALSVQYQSEAKKAAATMVVSIYIGKICDFYSPGEVAFSDITPCLFNCFGCHRILTFFWDTHPDFKLLKYHTYH